MNDTHNERINALMLEGDRLAQDGQSISAAVCWQKVLELEPGFPPALDCLAMQAAQRGDIDMARDLLEQAVAAAPGFAMAHAHLSRVHAVLGNENAALASIDDAIKADPAAWGPRMEKARMLEAKGRDREAAAAYGSGLAYMPEPARQAPELQSLVGHAQRMVAENQARLRQFLEGRLGDLMRTGSPRKLERFQHSFDVLTGRRDMALSRPLTLPFARLPSIPIFHREDFDWAPAVEAAFPDMLRELQALLEEQAEFVPYVQMPDDEPKGQFAPLNNNPDWGAYYFWKSGQLIEEHAQRCPLTVEALADNAPMCIVPNRAPVSFFSALKPGTHIAAHHGATNSRLTVHMPLIIPPDCALRVGGETHAWKPGELVMFDDTILHEAWNNSDRLRVVLIFDVWHPMLSDLERQLVSETIAGILEYNDNIDMGEL
ncbi:aspartyl/asparaginyl beta-hydroxylase domain-containing protein [Luteimonas aestuarii]|nr:aspartyl/asparaginyl beta-hydroxylase domain-containing protein [Luteimonas aestuarii]